MGKLMVARPDEYLGKPDLRKVRGDIARQLLIEAMVKAVARHGLQGATLSVVAEIAGVSRSLISFHFQQKDQLLDEALRHGVKVYEAALQARLATLKGSALEQLIDHVVHDIGFAMQHPELLGMWYAVWGDATAMDHYRTTTLAHDRHYRAGYIAYFDALKVSKEVSNRASVIIDAFIDGLWLDIHMAPGDLNLDDARETTRVLIQGLMAQS